jgi:quercetin dioxygenase-like cupin family protein
MALVDLDHQVGATRQQGCLGVRTQALERLIEVVGYEYRHGATVQKVKDRSEFPLRLWDERPWPTNSLPPHDPSVQQPSSSSPVVLTATAVAALVPVPLATIEGVSHRVLWENDTSMAGVLTVDAGHRLGSHAHRLNHHHMWVLEGSAVILGVEVGPGSYVHIPGGVEHDIDATGSSGCAVFYLYLPPGQ